MKIVNLDNVCNLINDILSQSYLITCIGSPLRSDDRAALELCNRVSDLGVPVVICEYGLENCIYELIEKSPKRIAIFDAVIVNESIEGVVVLGTNEITDIDIAISSHSIPMKILLQYLWSMLKDLEILIVGIPAKNLDIGFDLSPEVEKIVNSIIWCFNNLSRDAA